MAEAESFPETTDAPAADKAPAGATIAVTQQMELPAVLPKPGPISEPTGRQTWRPTPTDATPPMSGPGAGEAPTRVQDAKTVTTRPPGVPDIPGYEIVKEIGRGGMGVVYKARQLDLNRPVALKMILGEYERPEQLIRFRLEAETAARVRHPNVVQVYDSGTCNGRPYLVLEWVDGGTLSEYVKGKVQSPRAAARTISLLARALHATHCAGIVHRDLKPGNILISRIDAANASTQTGTGGGSTSNRADSLGVTLSVDGQPVGLVPKVTDFGLAKEMSSDTHLTETGRVLGTPEYMAPEQATGKHRAVGPATDVYALGIILYQMLTDRTPFHDKSVVAIMRRVVEEEPKPPRSHQPKVPRDLETICLKCLQKNPGRRYATADALANDLDCFLDGRPITARPTGSLERAWKWAQRRPAVAACAAAAASFFVLGFAGVTWQWRATLAAEQVAVGQRDRAEAAEKQVSAEKAVVVTERDRALKAEAVTDAVNHFVIDDLLETATPEKQLGRKITVEEVLQNASTRIDGRFADKPEVAAAIRLVLGNSYRKLGKFEPAGRHLAAALDLRRKTFGDTNRATLAAASDRGLLLADQRNWGEAVPLLRQVVADSQNKNGADDPLTVAATERLALVLQERGDSAEAEGLFKKALATSRRVFGKNDPFTLNVLNDFGMLLRARQKLPEAEAAFKEAADGRAKTLAPNHPATLESKHNLAVVLNDQGRWADAKTLYEQVLADKRRVLGVEHLDTLQTMNALADLLGEHGEPDAALGLLDEAYEGFRKALGPENPATLAVQSNLGKFSFDIGKRYNRKDLLERSEHVLAAVLAVRRRILQPGHPDVLLSVNNLAALLVRLQRLDDAEPYVKEALEGRRKTLGPGNLDTLETVTIYAQALDQRKKWAEAAAECRDALAAAEKDGNAEHPIAIDLLCFMVEMLEKSRPADALAPAERALVLTRKVHGETGDETMRARYNLGAVLVDIGQPADAEPHLRAAYDGSRAANPADLRTFSTVGKLRYCLIAQKKYADAEALLMDNYETLRSANPMSKLLVRSAGERVVKLYETWGKPDKVAEWREKVK